MDFSTMNPTSDEANDRADHQKNPASEEANDEADHQKNPASEEASDEAHHRESQEHCDGDQSVNNSAKSDNAEETDPFGYTKQEQFTSEIFKVEINNLPRFGFKELKKRLASIKVNPVKIKAINKNKFAFVTFRNEEERDDALRKIEGHVWKGNKLTVKKAVAVADPLLKKRKMEQENINCPTAEKRTKPNEDSDLSPEIRLKNAVTPLWNMAYEEQLKMKFKDMEEFLKNFANQIYQQNHTMRKWLQSQRLKYGGHCCEVLPIKASPVTTGYRNKCEFTVGQDLHGQDNTIGFRYGQYKSGNSCVGDPSHLTNISDTMKEVVMCFQEYCRSGQYGAFNPEKQEGHWKTLTVRTCQGSGVLAMLDFHPRNLQKEAIEAEKERLREYFISGPGKDSSVTCVYFHLLLDRVTDSASFQQVFDHIWGEKVIEETLLGMKFNVSPDAFFQVNTLAAEVLYSQIGDWCNVSPTTTVLDICCGTGTIGLTLAKKVSQVIGIDNCEQAVNDAKENAALNGVTNVTYHCCKVEDIISKTLKTLTSPDVVAVVDPPRAGLHQRVIRALRNCPLLSKIVYVSCNPKGAMNNFRDLVRTPSRHNKGEPYRPVRANPVDMFPQTRHCELVTVFEREVTNFSTNRIDDLKDEQTEEDGDLRDEQAEGDEDKKIEMEEDSSELKDKQADENVLN